MERYWTKKRLDGLRHGDVEAVRQWQLQFGRFIYTWFYFQLDKDESRAAILTAQTLSEALSKLSAFDPERTTMYLWLKEIAAEHLQSAVTLGHVTVRRPLSWSQLPSEVLEAMRRLRSEPIGPEVAGCTAVIEMVQATLADLSEQDRDLLIRRYIRLETVDHIATELGASQEKVNQQLYMARHAFRRGLFYLFQSVNANASEVGGAAGVDVFESNLETLLRSVNPAATIQADHAEQIKRVVLQTASELAKNPPIFPRAERRLYLKLVVVVGVAVAVGLMVAWIAWRRGHQEPTTAGPTHTDSPDKPQTGPADAPSKGSSNAAGNVAEIQHVLEIGMRGDVAGLLEVLKTGSEIAQLAAAHYLGQFGDEAAIEPLELAQSRWFPNGSPDNPFAQAIAQIRQRLEQTAPPQEPTIPESSEPTPPVQQETEREEQAQPPAVSGRVTGFDGTFLAGVEVAVRADGAALPAEASTAITAATDEQGRYALKTLPEGLVIISVRDPQRRIATTRCMIWPVKDRTLTLDFGGPNAVAGAVMRDGRPLAEQTVLLSDHFHDPERGVFTVEMQTDAEGVFFCTGVPTGRYGLWARLVGNRWTLLEHIDVERADVSVLVDSAAVELAVQMPDLPEFLQATSVSLRYSPDSSDTLAVWSGVKTEQQTEFRIYNVIPTNYTLCVDFSNKVRWMHDVAVDQRAEQIFVVDEIPYGPAGLTGRFLSDWPEGLTLEAAEPPIRISLMPDQDGSYALDGLPPAMYAVGATINGLFVPYVEIGLFDDQPVVYDLDPQQLAKSRSPVYVYVTDADGRGLAGGQVWLADEAAVYPAVPFEEGFFAAAPPGRYTLYAAFAGFAPAERPVNLAAANLRAPRDKTNTVVVRLSP